MRSKITELASFAVGLGVIYMVLPLWLSFALQPEIDHLPPSNLLLILIPGAVMALVGGLLLATRSSGCVRLTVGLLVLAFVVDALLLFHPVKLAFSGFGAFLICKTGDQALRENGKSEKLPQVTT